MVDEFMIFQDELEEAVAKAAVLPKWLAKPLFLSPVAAMRMKIANRLCRSIVEIWGGKGQPGLWLSAIRQCSRPGGTETISADEAAHLCVGLLFASHKNLAICLAQTVVTLYEDEARGGKWLGRLRAEVESDIGTLTSEADFIQAYLKTERPHTLVHGCLRENLRLTAHSIGALRKVVAPEGWQVQVKGLGSYTVPMGAYVGASHVIPNRDPKYFPEPLRFDPTRFSGGMRGLDEFVYTTFSQGGHKCPGESYSFSLMELLMNLILCRYDLQAVGRLPEIDWSRATLAQRKGVCLFTASPRW
mmetsp:Transcript_37539/g.58635  ORF Transcript_37539/g.58635 Transcript_37539/m.58635 type:complete len:302 (-) Transcript_37539:119-1024(-)